MLGVHQAVNRTPKAYRFWSPSLSLRRRLPKRYAQITWSKQVKIKILLTAFVLSAAAHEEDTGSGLVFCPSNNPVYVKIMQSKEIGDFLHAAHHWNRIER